MKTIPNLRILFLLLASGICQAQNTNIYSPTALPGKGLAQHDFLYAGEGHEERMFIVHGGQIVWSYTHPGRGEISEAVLEPDGHILFAHQFGITEITLDKQVVWNFDAPSGIEIHTAKPIGTNSVMFIENAKPAKLIVMNKSTSAIEHEFELPVNADQSVHRQFRRAELTAAGTVLVSFLDLGRIVEYDWSGKALWSYDITNCWSATELANGDILAATSGNQFVREINRKGETVWEWTAADAPDYKFSNTQVATRLANGNTLINNWFSQSLKNISPSNLPVQAIEATPDKKIVWALRSWTPPADLGPSTTIQILDGTPLDAIAATAAILTPPAAATPRINGPKIFGGRPGSPFQYSIPATGDRPMQFSADDLPRGLQLDAATGRITGELPEKGAYEVMLHASNSLGQAERPFKIVVGGEIGLTPAMGWNNYNLTGAHIDQKIILAQAHAMVDSGLAEHGWVYCNTDDGWQGLRGGEFNAIQPDPRDFPDIAGMVKEIHGLGLKAGIYSSPWVTTYDRHIGGTSENADGSWSRDYAKTNSHDHSQKFPFAIGKYHFAEQDARQFAAWGFDYLKYDWAPIHDDATKEMSDDLRAARRDFLFSLSNNGTYTLLKEIGEVSKHANSWRVTDDVHDNWKNITNSAFSQDAWASYSRPGHFNDPDMLVIGVLGWGRPHPTHLTPDEQYTQISMWCLLSAPLLLGCDLQKLDAFTYSLISNDEVLDVDQDSLGKQAVQVGGEGDLKVYAKPLDDGSLAVGLFNAGASEATVTANWPDLKLTGKQRVRDLWRQKDLGVFTDKFEATVAPHGVVLVRMLPSS